MARPRRPTAGQRPIRGRYVNYFQVGHNAFEFIVDFGQYDPDAGEANLHTRIVTGPVYAKLLSTLLCGAVEDYEREHGTIVPVDDELDPLEVIKASISDYDRLSPASHRRVR